jgi:hypothetical protein
MMQQLGEYDGVGVVVGHPDSTKGHYINRDTVTSQNVFISSQPYGHGMREGLSFVYQRLTENLGVTLKNR